MRPSIIPMELFPLLLLLLLLLNVDDVVDELLPPLIVFLSSRGRICTSSSKLNKTPPMLASYMSRREWRSDWMHWGTLGRDVGRRATDPCIVLI